MKKIFVFLFLLLVIPFKVNAATRLITDNNKPTIGANFDVNVEIDYGNTKLATSHYIIKYDTTCLSLANFKWDQSVGIYNVEDGLIYIDKESTTPAWKKGNVLTLSFRVDKICNTTIEIKDNGDTYNDKNEFVRQSVVPLTISSVENNSDTQVNFISPVDQVFTTTFNRKVNNYEINVKNDVEKIDFIVEINNNKQKITSNAEITHEDPESLQYKLSYTLKYGTNKVNITIQAETGDTNTYAILINRDKKDEEDISLKKLSVSNTNIKLVDYKDTYTAKVPTSVDSVLITAVASSSDIELRGTGTKKIIDGENEFKIYLTAPSGKERTYTIIIERTDLIEEKPGSTNIKTLKVNGNFVEEIKKNYIYGVTKEINTLNIDIELESETADYKIEGNNLEEGFNTVIISVFDDNTDTQIYNLYVYKDYSTYPIIEDLNDIKAIKSHMIYKAAVDSKHIISKDIVSKFKKAGKTLYYSVINDNKGILYQVIIDNSIAEALEIDATIEKEEKEVLTYNSNVPSGIQVKLYLDTEEYSNGETIKVYSYEEEGNYRIVNEGAVVENGYVTFTTNENHHYIFTKQSLLKGEDNTIKMLNQYKDYIMYGIFALIAIILILTVSKVSRKKKISKSQ